MEETSTNKEKSTMDTSRAQQIIEQLRSGKDFTSAVKETLNISTLGGTAVELVRGSCQEEGCDYVEPEDKRGLVPTICGQCNKRIFVNPSELVGQHKLAYLRPGDHFVFVTDLPLEESQEYIILKASRRGLIAFAPVDNQEELQQFTMEDAIKQDVELRSASSLDGGRFKFCEGDKVLHTLNGKHGFVLDMQGLGYNVCFDGEGKVSNRTEWVQTRNLERIDVEQTTRNYIVPMIQESEIKGYRIQLGLFSKEENTLQNALRLLYYRRRTAFYRLSRYIKEHPDFIELNEESKNFLVIHDKKFWKE